MRIKSFKNFSEIFKKYIDYKGKNLIVLDIDNTIFKTPTNYGSDQWFDWQVSILNKNKFSVATNFNELLNIYTEIHRNINLLLCEENMPMYIKKFKQKGFHFILLTARNGDTYNNIKKNLKYYDIWDCIYKNKNINNLIDIKSENTQEPLYKDGLLMAAGNNKSKILINYLQQLDFNFDKIIFIDDKAKNLEDMQNIQHIDLILYTNQHEAISDFFKNHK